MRYLFQALFYSILAFVVFISCGESKSQNDVSANFTVANIFTDHAVLQRDKPIVVWGTGQPNKKVKVTIDEKEYTGTVDTEGRWEVSIGQHAKGGDFVMEIVHGKSVEIRNNLTFGDVWLCSGQSNMEWTMSNSFGLEEAQAEGANSKIRHFKVSREHSEQPLDTIPSAQWTMCDASTVGDFTAVGFFFAQHIREHHDVPIGLLNSSWGGSRIEPWMRKEIIEEETFQKFAEMKKEMEVSVKENLAAMKKLFGTLPKSDLGMKGNDPIWAAEALNTDDWRSIPVPGYWERNGYEGLDGIIWLRKEIELSAAEASKKMTLHLAKIDDSDWTYVNGQLVGETKNSYNEFRRYDVDENILKPGKNIIAVRIDDTGYAGGIWDEPDSLYYAVEGKRHSLVGPWKMNLGKYSTGQMADGIAVNQLPTLLYNAMIHPIEKFPVAGFLWYQGESNAGSLEDARAYEDQFKTMITDWRKIYNDPKLPFLFVQLASFNTGDPDNRMWSAFRDHQMGALELPYTAQATAMDIGNPVDIHPRNKKDVGRRLAIAARNLAYGEKDLVYVGPTLAEARQTKNGVLLKFENAGSGLKLRSDSGALSGFEMSTDGTSFESVKAQILDANTVQLYTKKSNIKSVAYAWKNADMAANLENSDGLPAVPFQKPVN